MKIPVPILLGIALPVATLAAAPLASWNDTPSRRAVTDFVDRVTDTDSADYVPEPERIAVFDNDGTLWSEKPLYTQLQFAIDRVKLLAEDNPRWKRRQPFRKLFAASPDEMVPVTREELLEVVMVSHAGMTTDVFDQTVHEWLASARHPTTGRRYAQMAYQPMLELLDYLRDNGFQVYIVSGGGVEFMRVFAEEVYGIPPNHVVGTSIRTRYEVRDGTPSLVRLPEVEFVNDKEGKPVAINKFIGRRPIAAFGNSDGDFEMLEWTTAGSGARFGLLVHHDDAAREFAYDRESLVGRLDRALDEAPKRGWTVLSMKDDWKRIFAEPAEP